MTRQKAVRMLHNQHYVDEVGDFLKGKLQKYTYNIKVSRFHFHPH